MKLVKLSLVMLLAASSVQANKIKSVDFNSLPEWNGKYLDEGTNLKVLNIGDSISISACNTCGPNNRVDLTKVDFSSNVFTSEIKKGDSSLAGSSDRLILTAKAPAETAKITLSNNTMKAVIIEPIPIDFFNVNDNSTFNVGDAIQLTFNGTVRPDLQRITKLSGDAQYFDIEAPKSVYNDGRKGGPSTITVKILEGARGQKVELDGLNFKNTKVETKSFEVNK